MGKRQAALLAAGIAVLTAVVFGQVITHQFVAYDDGQFVYENPHVRAGLTLDSIRWAFASAEIGYYPLTWLSHMADVDLWGVNAGAHLVTALLLHIASSCLLFFALATATGAPLRSAVVAALFAIHPAHVESVAWISERKDTLSTLFGMIALLLYVRPPTLRRQIGVCVMLAASLLAKQMLVTLPFVFLILDWWPLRRGWRVIEKLPLFAIAAAGAILAIIGQRNLNAIQSSVVVPFSTRLQNAMLAYVRYIGKLLWPDDLAPLYPLRVPNAAAAGLAFALLVAITVAAWVLRKRAPYLLAGWLWFVGTLVPVIGIVQIGATELADRYTYFPSIGLFIAIVWVVAEVVPERVAVAAAAITIAALAVVAFIQVSRWKDTETLFTYTLQVTGPNPVAEYTLGQSLETRDPDRAIEHLRRAIELSEAALRDNIYAQPPAILAQSYVGVGTALLTKARTVPDNAHLIDDAIAAYEGALRFDPNAGNAKRNLALARSMRGVRSASDVDRALDEGVALSRQHRFDEAIAAYRRAVALAPQSAPAHVYLGIGLAQAQRNAEAASELRAAAAIDRTRANRFVTGILRLQSADDNLDRLIAQLEHR